MTYTVHFKGRDAKSVGLDDDNAQSLMRRLADATKPFMVVLGEDMVSSTEIKSLSKNVVTEADVPKAWANENRQLIAGKVCKAEYSIQKEINRIAMGQKDWPKKIKSEKWREAVRKKLWESTKEWCDYREQICSCDR